MRFKFVKIKFLILHSPLKWCGREVLLGLSLYENVAIATFAHEVSNAFQLVTLFQKFADFRRVKSVDFCRSLTPFPGGYAIPILSYGVEKSQRNLVKKWRDKRLTLKELRLAAGLQQADVAKRLHVTETAVSNWELGKNAISRKYHKKLAKLYGVSVEELLSGKEGA